MPKLIYVPAWLSDALEVQGESIQCLGTKDIKSVIVSGQDVINYIQSQVAFAKLLAFASTANNIPATICNIYEQAYAEMFHDYRASDDPTISVLIKRELSDLLINEEKLGYPVNTMGFDVEASECGRLIFVKGKLAANTGLTLSAVSQQLMSDIMCVAHNVVRVHSGAVDKSSVLRENPTLALFYVKSLLAS